MVSRRTVLRLASASAAAAIAGVRFATPVFAQPGAWLNAGGTRVSFASRSNPECHPRSSSC